MFVTLMYHLVDRTIDSPIAVSEEAFEDQLAHLARERIPVLTLADVLRITSGEMTAPERGVFLTLDDGYTDNLYAAMPRLREHGFEATLFVPTAYVGADNRWDTRARHRARHLDWLELERWLAGGGQIGGHTHAHEHAEEVTPERLRASIELNRQLLDERLGVEPVAFAYPYGIGTPEARREVARHYRVAWVGNGGTWDPAQDPLRLNRVWIDPKWKASAFGRELDTLFDYLVTGWSELRPKRPSTPRTSPAIEVRARPRVAMVVDRWDLPLGHPVGLRLVDLLDNGWDAHVLHNLGGSFDRLGLDDLPLDVLRNRVHPPPASLQRREPRRELVWDLLRRASRHPLGASRALLQPGDPGTAYVRAMLLALNPDLVDVTSQGAARQYAGLAGVLDGRVVIHGEGASSWPRADAIYVEHEAALASLPSGSVIAPPVDSRLLDWELPFERARRPLRVLAVGPFVWQQGYEHLLDAIRLVNERGAPGCKARMIGAGPHESAVYFARFQLGLESTVEILPPGRRAAFLEHLRWADVLVHSAVVPSSPPWLRDAQAAGRPVLATALPPGCESEPVLSAATHDSLALADRLTRFAVDRALGRALGEAGRSRARELIGVDDQLARFRALYERALA